MFLLNLTLGQFLALFGTLSAVVVTLYLLDRSRHRQRVATLRFWVASEKTAEVRHRKRIQQPLSLILQLLGIALLLLALAQLRFGAPGAMSRDHVLLLDVSAWMAARAGDRTFMEESRGAAQAYIRALPSSDRIMLVRADALATPATAFESNRQVLDQAIAESSPGATALNLSQAVEFARQAQRLQGGRPGEIVYIGASRIPADGVPPLMQGVPNFRVLPVKESVENCGLRQIGLRRSPADPDVWEVLVGIRNYGTVALTLPLEILFGGSIVGTRRLTVEPGSEQNATFQFRTRAAGWLDVRLLTKDALPEDDHATLEVPAQKKLRVAVYSAEPNLLRPVLAANPHVVSVFRKPDEFGSPGANADVLIFDRFRPKQIPEADAIWIEPPAQGSPVPVRATLTNVPLTRWRYDNPLAAGLRAKDIRLESAEVFDAPAAEVIAETESGPVVVARSGKNKMVALGFHPGRATMRYELTTPLLFANILRWMGPEIFRRWELNTGRVGTVNVALASEREAASVKVVSGNGSPLPFTVEGQTVRFFTGTPGTVRVIAGDREQVYSLTLPEVAEALWQPPKQAHHGIPAPAPLRRAYAELWPWLAALAGAVLLAEWILFGRSRLRASVRPMPRRTPGFLRKVSGGLF